MTAVLSKIVYSIMMRLTLIFGAMACMIGAAVFVSWAVFQSIEKEMAILSGDSLPQMRASAGITHETDKTRDVLTRILSAQDAAHLAALTNEKTALIADFATALERLPTEQRNHAAPLLEEVGAALTALLAARQTELRATQDTYAMLDSAFGIANLVGAQLEEAADSAFFDMTLSGDAAIASIDDTLTNLVDRDFAQLQTVLAVQSEVNLLTGLALTLQQGAFSASASIVEDLAVSSIDRIRPLLETAQAFEELGDVATVVAEALGVYEAALNSGSRSRGPAAEELLALRVRVDGILSPALDDVYFNLVIGSDDAKSTSQSALNELLANEVAAMRDMAALDAATKSFFSLALKTALTRSLQDLTLAEGGLEDQALKVRSLMDVISDDRTRSEVGRLLELASRGVGIVSKRSAVIAAQSAAAEATTNATRAVGAIAQTTNSLSAAALNSIDQTAEALSRSVEAAGSQIINIAIASLALTLAAPFFVWLLVTRPLNRVTSTTERLAGGDLSEIEGLRQNRGELGRMATALHVFRDNALQTIKMREEEKLREAAALEAERLAERERLDAVARQEKQQKEREEESRKQSEAARKAMLANLNASVGSVVTAASKGDFSKRVELTFDDEELAGLAGGVNLLVDRVEVGLTATGNVLAKVASGDLTETIEGEFFGAFATLQSDANGMIDALRKLVAEISESGNGLAFSSAELRDTAGTLSRQAEQNAASLEETSAALEELSASIKHVSLSATEASESVSTARATAQASGEVATEAASSMKRIAEASDEISKVVNVINEIATQINLLALNAGVEAARAGEAGHGFAVVASEVRHLAQRASEASSEIREVISRSNQAVAQGVEKVDNAQSYLSEIAENVVNVSTRVDDISHAIAEQVNGIGEITKAVANIDQNTQKQVASFEEVTAASGLLASEAAGLQSSTGRFKTVVAGKARFAAKPSRPSPALRPQAPPVSAPRRVAKVVGGQSAVLEDGWDEF